MVESSRFRLRQFISHSLNPVDNGTTIDVHITLRLFLFYCLSDIKSLFDGLFCSLKSDPRCVHSSFVYLHPDSVTYCCLLAHWSLIILINGPKRSSDQILRLTISCRYG